MLSIKQNDLIDEESYHGDNEIDCDIFAWVVCLMKEHNMMHDFRKTSHVSSSKNYLEHIIALC